MRNLKKVLSLVLCVAMLLSVMVMGTGAVTLTDSEDISPQYREAAEVLTGMGIINGYEDDSFKPQQSITRAEVATMIYRAATSDVTDSQTGLYVDYDKFIDVDADDWFAGYVNFCGNAELIKGYEDDSFRATENVTGYQVLAMILRAVGYDQNGEFTGTGWEIRTASTAQSLDILKNVQEATLGQAATRELVAELIFQALNVPTVTYMPAIGYVEGDKTLGEQEFDLTKGNYTAIDEWGRPGYEWYADSNNNNTLNDNETVYATIEAVADATYTEAVTECDIAADTNVSRDTVYPVIVNGQTAVNYTVQPKDTVQEIGAQGRLTEVYYNYDGEGSNTIVMIDTFLAQVTDVKDATFDANGHLRTDATITLALYDANTASTTSGKSMTLTNGATNYDYAKGDMVLLNAYTTGATAAGGNALIVTAENSAYGEIVGLADSIVGSQTEIHYNDGQHTISGTTYTDASELHLDQAQKQTTNHTWYFDQYDNLIGVTDIAATYSYGTIKNIQWINPQGANGYAQATLVLMDGSEVTETITGLNGFGLTYQTTGTNPGDVSGNNYVISTNMAENNVITGLGLYQISETSTGVSLYWVNTQAVMDTVSDSGRMTNATITAKEAYINGSSSAPSTETQIVTDEATQYLIRSEVAGSYVYTPVTGVGNISSYTGATVDFVDTDNDNRAEYVYFWGNEVNAAYTGLFYPTTLSYREVLQENGVDVDYYVMTGYVDGNTSPSELIIPAAYRDTALQAILDGGANQLYTVNFNNGNATSATKVPNTGVTIDADNGKYLNHSAYYATGDALYQDGVLTVDGFSFYVTDATTVFGELTEGTTYDNHDIYVVYTDTNSTHYATEIYVAEKPDTPEEPSSPTTGTVVYNVTMYMPDGTTQVRNAVWTGTGTFDAGSQLWSAISQVYFPDLAGNGWTVLQDQPQGITVDAGDVLVLNYIIRG